MYLRSWCIRCFGHGLKAKDQDSAVPVIFLTNAYVVRLGQRNELRTGGCGYAFWLLAVNGEHCKAVTLPLVFHRTKSENVASDCSDGAALKTGCSLNTTTAP